MQKISMLLFLALFLLSCQPEEGEFTDLNLTVRTGIQDSKEKNEANRIRVRNIEALRKLPFSNTKNRKEVLLLGYYEPGDGGGGVFAWNPESTENDNGGTVIAANRMYVGRWERIFEGALNVRWFGAKGDGVSNDTEYLQKAFLLGKEIYIPKTEYYYYIKNTLSVKSNVSSNGARFFSNVTGITLMEIEANNITISGLKIIGHDTIIGLDPYVPSITTGISIKDYDYLTVMDCELAGWSYAAIFLFNSKNNHIWKNYIHHNRRKGWGYGIALHNTHLLRTNVLVNCNYFEFNRHDIAGSGNENLSYEASYNIIGQEGGENQHRFDMHGKNGDKEIVAGTKISVHHNSFLSDQSFAILIRGIPEEEIIIYENKFAHKNIDMAFRQTVLKKLIIKQDQINVNIGKNYFETIDKEKNKICFP